MLCRLPRFQVIKPATPATILSGIAHWYRSDLGITLNTGKVSQWNDQVGTAHVAQATGSNQPTYNATDAGYSGLPTVQSTASSQYLFASSVTHSQPIAVWLIGEYATTGGVIAGIGGGYINNSANIAHMWAGTDVASADACNTKRATLAVFNGASSLIGCDDWVSGGTTGNAGTGTMTALGMFATPAGSSGSTGKLAEVVVSLGVPTSGEKASMASYILSRYGVTVT